MHVQGGIFKKILHCSVATQLRCGGILNNLITADVSHNVPIADFWKSINIWQRHRQKFVAYFFG